MFDQEKRSGRKAWTGNVQMEELEDQILRVAKGDTGALEALYKGTRTVVYGLALSIVRNPQDAEDLMQDTYLRVYRGAASYRPQGKPLAWILRITRNLSLDKVRSKPTGELPLEEAWIPAPGSDISESTLDRLLLQGLLSRLSEEERQIVILHSVEQFKHREIAELLDIPLGTALSKYRRSLSKLRKMLEEDLR